MFLSSITLYDVVWGTAVPVFFLMFICLIIVFYREMCQYTSKGDRTFGDFLLYLITCPCWLPQNPLPQLPSDTSDKQNEQQQQKQQNNSEKLQEKDENENKTEGSLQTVVTTS